MSRNSISPNLPTGRKETLWSTPEGMGLYGSPEIFIARHVQYGIVRVFFFFNILMNFFSLQLHLFEITGDI